MYRLRSRRFPGDPGCKVADSTFELGVGYVSLRSADRQLFPVGTTYRLKSSGYRLAHTAHRSSVATGQLPLDKNLVVLQNRQAAGPAIASRYRRMRPPYNFEASTA